jgi:hypothetical protein
MFVKKFLDNQTKKEINKYVFKNTIRYFVFLIIVFSVLYFLKSINLISLSKKGELILALILFFSGFIYKVIQAVIGMYIYYIKRKGRSLIEVSWEEMKGFEKDFFIKGENLISQMFIFIAEGAIFLLIFVLLGF